MLAPLGVWPRPAACVGVVAGCGACRGVRCAGCGRASTPFCRGVGVRRLRYHVGGGRWCRAVFHHPVGVVSVSADGEVTVSRMFRRLAVLRSLLDRPGHRRGDAAAAGAFILWSHVNVLLFCFFSGRALSFCHMSTWALRCSCQAAPLELRSETQIIRWHVTYAWTVRDGDCPPPFVSRHQTFDWFVAYTASACTCSYCSTQRATSQISSQQHYQHASRKHTDTKNSSVTALQNLHSTQRR